MYFYVAYTQHDGNGVYSIVTRLYKKKKKTERRETRRDFIDNIIRKRKIWY